MNIFLSNIQVFVSVVFVLWDRKRDRVRIHWFTAPSAPSGLIWPITKPAATQTSGIQPPALLAAAYTGGNRRWVWNSSTPKWYIGILTSVSTAKPNTYLYSGHSIVFVYYTGKSSNKTSGRMSAYYVIILVLIRRKAFNLSSHSMLAVCCSQLPLDKLRQVRCYPYSNDFYKSKQWTCPNTSSVSTKTAMCFLPYFTHVVSYINNFRWQDDSRSVLSLFLHISEDSPACDP